MEYARVGEQSGLKKALPSDASGISSCIGIEGPKSAPSASKVFQTNPKGYLRISAKINDGCCVWARGKNRCDISSDG